MISSNAKWIWVNSDPQKNEYAYFEGEYDWSGEEARLSLAAETDADERIMRMTSSILSMAIL